MKLVHKLAFVLVSLFAAGTACAETIESSFNNNTSVNSTGAPLPLVHNLLLGSEPFRIGIDEITSAFLTIRLTDDAGRDGGGDETFIFNLGNGESYGGANQGNPPTNYGYTLLDLDSLNATGMLNFTVQATTGAFIFLSSTLEVEVTRGEIDVPPTGVPEPLSIALMALGLAGMAGARRRK